MPGRFPKKRFSQVFLADKKYVKRIIDKLEITSDDTIIEIGSGRGTLTELIAKTGARLYSFEIDRDLIDVLEKKFAPYENVTIINQNFLETDPKKYFDGKFKLIGNIPYDITSPLLDWMIQYQDLISLGVLTTQKELAQRISSSSGSKNWAPISIFCQCAFDVQLVFDIPPKAFYPPPKIYSSTMVFKPEKSDGDYQIKDRAFFEKIVRQSFLHRRKQLVNNLSKLPEIEKDRIEKILEELNLKRNCRAEQIDINSFIRLSELLNS
ncbi:MAG: ribosomal RNA small subunit methyltransferase A [candidate division Zixibacteria bacterium]|nr:ribosomal RNA small subunit methyltransferase A [candidate division Zixibacteria bacterium]